MQLQSLRDVETNDSLLNMPEITDSDASSAMSNPSHTEQLQRKVSLIRENQTKKAWELLREGRYHQSRKAFQRVGVGVDDEVAPAIGEFVSAVVDRQYRSAVVRLQSMLRRHPGMFSEQYPLESILPSPRIGEQVLSECAAVVTANPDSADFAAIQAFILWIDSDSPVKQAAAIKAATRLRDQFRTSKYAEFLDKIQEELDAREVPGDTPDSTIG
ncbi:MAG: hypothetical protein DHS20C16_24250 [Phycisphaerae bacterium]|nr:MAG: hypothetical protein DHS20C16_24250 [Phycisphaerae bacterium]